MAYCHSRYQTIRRITGEVKVGQVGVGGSNPIRVQSMTTSDTQDVAATVKQSIALAEVGCEIVRITAPNVAAAKCLKEIRTQLSAAGFSHIPLVADIHFLPSAAMEAVEHVEKVRVNPGNYADKKKFAVREYSTADYDLELERLHDSFSPLVKRAKELGRAIRIGTNHGSLSDRIMNRYGDTPLGMVESALEFLRIAQSHGFDQLILSMKASNPKVMIEAYRLLVDRMNGENMRYPLHLGVTEAGDGEDGRIKSAIGIGSLLLDGLGDTIRVSLTEDSVYEIPVARALAEKAMSQWRPSHLIADREIENSIAGSKTPVETVDSIDPFHFNRRQILPALLSPNLEIGPDFPPRVIVHAGPVAKLSAVIRNLDIQQLKETPAEILLTQADSAEDLRALLAILVAEKNRCVAVEIPSTISTQALLPVVSQKESRVIVVSAFSANDQHRLDQLGRLASEHGQLVAILTTGADVPALAETAKAIGEGNFIFALDARRLPVHFHCVGGYRKLAEEMKRAGLASPIWIRNDTTSALQANNSFLSKLLESAILSGSLLCDGLGDFASIETETDPVRATKLAYNVLQGAGARISKTEFVACPSCGRTLFDLQSTTQRIREKTGHLKGVKLAIMGCIVNGPGEMADADFGYVGGAPGKINLYVGKTCVQYNIPQAEADERLVSLIKQHGKWREADPAVSR